jgi:DNA-binding NarL/FixJ family response regulator
MGEFGVVVITSRSTVKALFAGMGGQAGQRVLVTFLPLDARAVTDAHEPLVNADVAVIDASTDPSEVVGVCEALHAQRPGLPITAVFCCAHAATATDLRALLAAGVGGLLDLQLSAEETIRVLRGVARGQGAFHLQLAAGSSTSLSTLFASEPAGESLSDHDLGLLRLVALGLTDHEIGRQLYLSHHTVKHRIDRLRRRVNARNRIQLAAWAGQQALHSEADESSGEGEGATGGLDAAEARPAPELRF